VKQGDPKGARREKVCYAKDSLKQQPRFLQDATASTRILSHGRRRAMMRSAFLAKKNLQYVPDCPFHSNIEGSTNNTVRGHTMKQLLIDVSE
jgi:hypothetical protein